MQIGSLFGFKYQYGYANPTVLKSTESTKQIKAVNIEAAKSGGIVNPIKLSGSTKKALSEMRFEDTGSASSKTKLEISNKSSFAINFSKIVVGDKGYSEALAKYNAVKSLPGSADLKFLATDKSGEKKFKITLDSIKTENGSFGLDSKSILSAIKSGALDIQGTLDFNIQIVKEKTITGDDGQQVVQPGFALVNYKYDDSFFDEQKGSFAVDLATLSEAFANVGDAGDEDALVQQYSVQSDNLDVKNFSNSDPIFFNVSKSFDYIKIYKDAQENAEYLASVNSATSISA